MKILITGVAGFVGSHLAEYIHENQNAEIYGIVRPRTDLKNLNGLDYVNLIECDLNDQAAVFNMMNKVRPDYIFHLAAQSDVGYSFENSATTLTNNIVSELNLLDMMCYQRRPDYKPRILIAGSSEEYGAVRAEEFPIKENTPLRPLSPYAVSKVAQESLALQYARSYGLFVVVTRAFNHTGPRRGSNFAESSWAKQLAEGNKVVHGNLESYRDYTDVRDMVRAYWLAITRGESGEVYNICSGKNYQMRDVLNTLISISGKKSVELQQDPKRMRPSDLMVLLGDATKFRVVSGWEPKIPFEQTMKDLYKYWQENV